MIRFVYPNVDGIHDTFIGCGRFFATTPDDERLLCAGYELAKPNVVHLREIIDAAALFAPESQDGDARVYEIKDEIKDHPDAGIGIGDSLGLAYLFALINRSRKTCWPHSDQNIWCTGVIKFDGDTPKVSNVFQNQFEGENGKLQAFLKDTEARLFFVPAANMTADLRQDCKTKQVRVLSYAEFCTIPVHEHFAQKTIVQLYGHELAPLVQRIFPRHVRLQNPRDFTVKIRRTHDQAVVGTGIVVSASHIVTCAHVVEEAIGMSLCDAPEDVNILVYFPKASSGHPKTYQARIATYRAEYRDDVVVLQLRHGAPPLEAKQIAVLGDAAESEQHAFRAYGYQRTLNGVAGYVQGQIGAAVEAPDDAVVSEDPVQLAYESMHHDMSGAAILDSDRNLVIGIVSTFGLYSHESRAGWAINARVLHEAPFSLPPHTGVAEDDDASFSVKAAQLSSGLSESRPAVTAAGQFTWKYAPALLREWVGRSELLERLREDWQQGERRIIGLIGFGGEGKSSLARKTVEELRKGFWPNTPLPHATFGWNFYSRPNVDQFFEAVFQFLTADTVNPQDYPSTSLKARVVREALAGPQRSLFVLDGLEVMQHTDEERYGLLASDELRQFLLIFTRPDTLSCCVLTSRLPLLDCIEYAAYTQYDVASLTMPDSISLVRKLGVKAVDYADSALHEILASWGTHALTVNLLAKYLIQYQTIPKALPDEPLYARVSRILARYDECLSKAEQAFLMIFSLFRLPVSSNVFEPVFRQDNAAIPELDVPLATLSDDAFQRVLQRLQSSAIIRCEGEYSLHPLIRDHYRNRLRQYAPDDISALRHRITTYYVTMADGLPEPTSVDELVPLAEALHHTCRAGSYDAAYPILRERLNLGDRYLIADELGAWDTYLSFLQEFFADPESQESLMREPKAQGWFLHETGFCHMMLGNLQAAVPFYQRAIDLKLSLENWRGASIGYQNLAELYVSLGDLKGRAEADRHSLELARRAKDAEEECHALADQAWAEHLRGHLMQASQLFQQMETLQQNISDPGKPYVYCLHRLRSADHLRHIGNPQEAGRLLQVSLEECQNTGWKDYDSLTHRVFGDVKAEAGQPDEARHHYDEALRIIRSITRHDLLIDILMSRGRWLAQQGIVGPALSDLGEALRYAVKSGYRIYEADIRVALAWIYLAEADNTGGQQSAQNRERARQEAEQADEISHKTGYYWGRKDAQEIIQRLANGG